MVLLLGAICLQTATSQHGVVSLVGELTFPDMRIVDLTSYVDTATGNEYAIVGFNSAPNGILMIDVTDPVNPVVVDSINGIPGYDIKVFENYAYTVLGRRGTGEIVDLSNPEQLTVVGEFPSSHNIAIDPRGFLYSAQQGLTIFDLAGDPTNPERIWADSTTVGHDATIIGSTLYDFHATDTRILDVTNPANPVELGFIGAPFILYHHSGWTTEDGKYLFINDEGTRHPAADVTIWDISDPENPEYVASISDSTATVHNIHIRDNFAFFSYYSAGFKVFDITDPTDPVLVGHYDTDPGTGENFSGAFGVDALLPSRHVLISGTSDVTGSLHVFKVDGFTSVSTEGTEHPESTEPLSLEVYPNPFSDFTSVDLEPNSVGDLVMSDLLGRIVFRQLVTNTGQRQTITIPTDHLAQGVYLVRLTSDNSIVSRQVVKVN